jgi:hypothetical protein
MKTSPEVEREIQNMIARGISHRDIAETFNISTSTVSRIRNRLPQEPKEQLNHPKPRFDVPPQKHVDPLEFLAQAVVRTKQHPIDKDYAKIVIDTKKPIAVIKASDLHFGGLDIDYVSLQEHIKFLLDTPNFYLQLFGDDLNLMIMHRTVCARHDGWTPEEQVYWLESFVDECLKHGKLLSMCWGNHTDEFTERNAGFGLVRMLMKHKIPYFRGLGYIDLQVGKQTYPMGFTHKTRFNSFMNQLHGNKRLQQMHAEYFGINRMPCREYITAHTHTPAVSWEGCLPEDRVFFVKCGTFKVRCLYSQRYFGQGKIGTPTVVYHPDRVEHLCFPTPWEAHTYMKGLEK